MGHDAHDEVLRDIVRSVEQNSDLDPEHPDLLALKRILLEKISPADTGDGPISETTTRAISAEALPVDGSVSQALGLSTTGDAPGLPTDPIVSQALGLGTTPDQSKSSIEAGDNQPSNPSAVAEPSLPPRTERA